MSRHFKKGDGFFQLSPASYTGRKKRRKALSEDGAESALHASDMVPDGSPGYGKLSFIIRPSLTWKIRSKPSTILWSWVTTRIAE